MKFIKPNWSAPSSIHAYSTTRLNGVSKGKYAGLNLGDHVHDEIDKVDANRQLLAEQLGLKTPTFWLTQTHSTRLIDLNNGHFDADGDAAWTTKPQQAAIVMTADCLPILLTDKSGSFVAAIHAGWRGLCDGIIEQSISAICTQLNIQSQQLVVWLGPCIKQSSFQVGGEVRDEFIAQDKQAIDAFKADGERWLADLHQLARLRIKPFNVAEITASEHCTFSEPELFYSYRRDGVTGRMASLIWIES